MNNKQPYYHHFIFDYQIDIILQLIVGEIRSFKSDIIILQPLVAEFNKSKQDKKICVNLFNLCHLCAKNKK